MGTAVSRPLRDSRILTGWIWTVPGTCISPIRLNHRIRRVDAGTGIITTVAGGNGRGFGGDDGPATSARLINPRDVAFDGDGNLYIVDQGTQRIRKVDGLGNSPPVIASIDGPPDPIALVGNAPVVTAFFDDPDTADTHTCSFSWDDGQAPTSGTINQGAGSGDCSATTSFAEAGVYTVTATVTDDKGNSTDGMYEFVVIYDPSAGFVTGGGKIDSLPGAYMPDPTLAGKASFGFVSKYKKGANVPTGNTQFQFRAAEFNFHSSTYEWLVVAGQAKAQFKGSGTVNGTGGYTFLLTAIDGQQPGGGGDDKFRIKIWNQGSGVVYDNRNGVSDDIDTADPQVISGESIVVHAK